MYVVHAICVVMTVMVMFMFMLVHVFLTVIVSVMLRPAQTWRRKYVQSDMMSPDHTSAP